MSFIINLVKLQIVWLEKVKVDTLCGTEGVYSYLDELGESVGPTTVQVSWDYFRTNRIRRWPWVTKGLISTHASISSSFLNIHVCKGQMANRKFIVRKVSRCSDRLYLFFFCHVRTIAWTLLVFYRYTQLLFSNFVQYRYICGITQNCKTPYMHLIDFIINGAITESNIFAHWGAAAAVPWDKIQARPFASPSLSFFCTSPRSLKVT
jgi:hypothetical protein